MSIVSLVLRLAAVKALTGATFAQDRVYDSAIAPLDAKVGEGAEPMIVVYTDEEDGTVSSCDMLSPRRDLSFVIHCAVTNRVVASAGGVSIEIPHTDEGLEAVLDLMRHDIVAALQTGQGPWADLWRSLVISCKSIAIRRGASAKRGLRFAAREIALHVDTISDPCPGMGPSPFWDGVLDTLRTDPDLSGIADFIAGRLSAGAGWADWQRASAVLGLSTATKAALGGVAVPTEAPATKLGLTSGAITAFVAPDGDVIEFGA